MNRDVGRGTDTLQQASSSNYLIYLFVFSASFVVLLPYLLSFGGSVLRSSKKGTIKGPTSKTNAPYTYTSLSSDFIVSRDHIFEDRQNNLDMQIIDLQRTIKMERERTFHLENEIRILHLSERYLKERIQNLEDRDLEHRRSFSTGSAPIELLMQKTAIVQSKQGDLVAHMQELSRMLQAEKERSNALALEIKILRLSESVLEDRIKTLEDKFNALLSKDRQRKSFDSKYEQTDLAQY